MIEWFSDNFIWLTAAACGLYAISWLLEKFFGKKNKVSLEEKYSKKEPVVEEN